MRDSTISPDHTVPDALLGNSILTRVLLAFGLIGDIPATTEGLFEIYAAWCRKVPFDNIRKSIDLAGGGRLTGLSASEFFENWLEHGTGGTCWPSSNALCTLLRTLGFDARRVAGSMYDLGVINHGTVKVRVNGQDWLTDTCMLTYRPIPVNRELFIDNSKGAAIEVEPVGDSHVIWYDFAPSPVFVPCRLHLDPADADLYEERYERFSREYSPFNTRLYFRTGGPDGASVILGNVKFRRTDDGLDIYEFTRDGLCGHLIASGVSGDIVDRWIGEGGLEMSFDPANIYPSPEITGVRPSLRKIV
jgi:N-hydroxyarylamine O-acetyltransferase